MNEIDVLLIEDNEGDARLIEEELGEADGSYRLDHELTLADGLETLRGGGYDCLLLDLSLPDSHGLDTVKESRNAAPTIPIVVLTGLQDQEMALETLQEGAQDYVVKDRFEDVLPRAIRYAIERQRTTEEVRNLRRKISSQERLATLGALVAGVSRELRSSTETVTNTLYRLRQLADELAEEVPDGDKRSAEIGTAVGEAMDGLGRIDSIARNLRRFYRTGEGATEAADVDELVSGTVALYRESREAPGEIRTEPGGAGEISLNPVQIRQVILNLLENAVDASGPDGRIVVRTRATDAGVEIEVVDDGPGVPEGVREEMFEPFVTTKDGSDGLGLAVVKRIVDAHDGEIDVDTGGDGTTVTVRLPGT